MHFDEKLTTNKKPFKNIDLWIFVISRTDSFEQKTCAGRQFGFSPVTAAALVDNCAAVKAWPSQKSAVFNAKSRIRRLLRR